MIEFVFQIDSESHRGMISYVSQSCNQRNLYFTLASEVLEGFFEQYMLRESAKYQTYWVIKSNNKVVCSSNRFMH